MITHFKAKELYQQHLNNLGNKGNYVGVIGSAIVPLDLIANFKPKKSVLFDINPKSVDVLNEYKRLILESETRIKFIESISGITHKELQKLESLYKKGLGFLNGEEFSTYWTSLNLSNRFEGEKGSIHHKIYSTAHENIPFICFNGNSSFLNNRETYKNLQTILSKKDNLFTEIIDLTSPEFPKKINQYFKGIIGPKNKIGLISLSNIIYGNEDKAIVYLNNEQFQAVKNNIKKLNTTKNAKIIYGIDPILQPVKSFTTPNTNYPSRNI